MSDYWQLKDPDGGFVDPETGLQISRGEVVPIGPRRGKLTREKIAGGGIIPASRSITGGTPALQGADDATEPDKTDESAARSADPAEVEGVGAVREPPLPTTPEALAATRDQVIERRIGVLKEQTMKELRQAAKDLSLKIGAAISKDKLAATIAGGEWRREHGEEN